MTPLASSTRTTARLTAISAGWAFSVSRSVSSGPSNMIRASFCAQRLVDFVEHRPGLGIGLGEVLAHADGLAALPGKGERALRHDASRRFGLSATYVAVKAVSPAQG